MPTRRSTVRSKWEEGRIEKLYERHGEEVIETSDRFRDEHAIAPANSRHSFGITCLPRRIDPRDSRYETRQQTTETIDSARHSQLARQRNENTENTHRALRVQRRSYGRLRAPQLHHSTRTHTLYLRSRR